MPNRPEEGKLILGIYKKRENLIQIIKKVYLSSIGFPILELPEFGAFEGFAFLGFLTSFFPPLSLDMMKFSFGFYTN